MPPEIIDARYANRPETTVDLQPTGRKRKVNAVLLGTWLGAPDQDGDRLVMAQMKENASGADVWDSYTLTFKPNRP